eukprot:TRINITY_DN3725_c0_g1_i6.p1 TRINITY_DN3725_c0_g1~~TRINITY_DN3725_c0_g1_i6.p1  ORF type:complete len:118 (-),score=0.50 TRINITY_DN3725_c0_g1_i6:11-364(-)
MRCPTRMITDSQVTLGSAFLYSPPPIQNQSFVATKILLAPSQSPITPLAIEQLQQSASLPYFGPSDHSQSSQLTQLTQTFDTPLTVSFQSRYLNSMPQIGRAVQQECRDRSRMPSSA